MSAPSATPAAIPAAPEMKAGWVTGRAGRRWRTSWQPGTGVAVLGTVLFLPPLGDEMNHTRPLFAAAAAALAAAGWEVQCTDPFGTGDSDGEFAAASLAQWALDLADDVAVASFRGPCVLWGARQGALLLPELAAALQRGQVPLPIAVALWNPLWQGSAVVTQWLRLAAVAGSSAAASQVGPLRQQLAAGQPVVCGGYLLTAAFANELEHTVAMAWLGVPVREWDAVATGARRFWLPHEETTDITLVAPLVEWLATVAPAAANAVVPAAMNAVALLPRVLPASALLLEVPADGATRCGVLFVVGGPQYRVGAHRQFVRWSRCFNAAGHATGRFDRTGTGDVPGERAALQDCGPELCATLDAAVAATGIGRWVVFGLCDGATLALLHLAKHPALAGVVAVNPWVPVTAAEQAQALVNDYYGRRLFSGAFWARLLRGEVKVRNALHEWWQNRQTAQAGRELASTVAEAPPAMDAAADALATALRVNATALSVPVLWALSGNDRTAAEFRALVAGDERWHLVLAKPTATRLDLPEADHTLSTAADHDRLAAAVVEWLTRVA